MMKVSLPLSKRLFDGYNNMYIENGIRIPDNRPFVKLHSDFFHLSLRIHTWLVDQNISYTLGYNYTGEIDTFYFIEFENKDSAVLFKLAWG